MPLICCSCGYDPRVHFPGNVRIFSMPLIPDEPICAECESHYLHVWWKLQVPAWTRPLKMVVC